MRSARDGQRELRRPFCIAAIDKLKLPSRLADDALPDALFD